MVKVGIIGCGKIAQVRHIPEYNENPDVEIAGFFDWNRERAESLAKQYQGTVYPSAEAMLADPELDAVSVCVANVAHAEVTIKALEAGKHVLCEKPMAITLEECEAMAEAARRNGKYLMIGQNQRFAAAHVWARKLIQEGTLGDIITFRTTFGHGGPESWSIDPGSNTWFFDKNKAAMGAMADLGIHKTDLIQYLLGQTIKEVAARVVTLDKRDGEGNLIGVDDNAICIYTLDRGTIGTMSASWTHYGEEDNSTILYGTKGILHIYDSPDYSMKLVTRSGEQISYQIDQIQTNDHQTKSGVIDQFVDCIVNQTEPTVSGASVLTAMRAVFGALEASRTGKTVLVNRD